jgi:hypothetical protein
MLPTCRFGEAPGSLNTRIHLTLDCGPRFILGMGRMTEGLKIGELAERAGVSRDTVRFYERKGLLPRPRRTASQYRVYNDETAARLRWRISASCYGSTSSRRPRSVGVSPSACGPASRPSTRKSLSCGTFGGSSPRAMIDARKRTRSPARWCWIWPRLSARRGRSR